MYYILFIHSHTNEHKDVLSFRLLQAFLYKCIFGHMFLFLLDKYLGVEVLDYRVGVFIGNCQSFLQKAACIIMIVKGMDEISLADEFFLERVGIMVLGCAYASGYKVLS